MARSVSHVTLHAMSDLFTSDFKTTPYWWEKTPLPVLASEPLPAKIDVAVIGSGYTGLNAALVTARGDRSTVVFDAADAGFGCSTRNGGQISSAVKPSYSELSRRHGQSVALGIIKEGYNSLRWIREFVQTENIDCDYKVSGRFHAAHNPKQFRLLEEEVRNPVPGIEEQLRVVSRSEQHQEIGTDTYHGGVVYGDHAALDPAAYHQGLLQRAIDAGVQAEPHCKVHNISPKNSGYVLQTENGEVWAKDVIVATNGYTGELSPWQRRRVIPIGSYMIATEPLAADVMDRLMPTDRVYSDTCKVVYYYRATPDRKRILFGGRVSSGETDPLKSAPKLRVDMLRLFPELQNVRIAHSWMGFVAYTFDTLAHTGTHKGIHYAMGYCGSGVAMASYLGMRTGQRVLGKPEGATGLDSIKFPTRPLYNGKPWFLPATVAYYRYKDKLTRSR